MGHKEPVDNPGHGRYSGFYREYNLSLGHTNLEGDKIYTVETFPNYQKTPASLQANASKSFDFGSLRLYFVGLATGESDDSRFAPHGDCIGRLARKGSGLVQCWLSLCATN